MNIRDIILIIIIIYLIFSHKNKNIEKFALSTDDKNEVRTLIKEIYNTDMDAIRTLAKLADDIQKTGLQVNGNLIVTGAITSTGDIKTNGEIKTLDKNNTEKISLNTSITGINSSLSSLSTSISSVNSTLTTSINSVNATMPVFVHFVANGNTDNYNHHCWNFTSDSEVFLTWPQPIIVRNNLVARARSLGYALPEARVKMAPFGWDFRNLAWSNFVINVPTGKACRIFGWVAQNNNDTYYGPGVHHVSSLNLSPNGFHGVWAGLESIKYNFIPQGYSMSSFNY